jgi:hypothetical protein
MAIDSEKARALGIDIRAVCDQCGSRFPPRFSDAREPLRFCERLCERRHGIAVGLIPTRRKAFHGSKLTAHDRRFLRQLRISQY